MPDGDEGLPLIELREVRLKDVYIPVIVSVRSDTDYVPERQR